MEELRERMSEIEDPRQPSYVKYSLADILIIVMCGVLSGLDTLGDLGIYAKSKKAFLSKELGIESIPSTYMRRPTRYRYSRKCLLTWTLRAKQSPQMQCTVSERLAAE